MTRKIFLLPPISLFVISFIFATSSNQINFWLWFFTFLFSSLIFLPVAFSFDDKKVPVFQIFFIMIFFLIFFARLAFWDFLALRLKTSEAFFYGIATSFGLLAAIMLIKGQKD